MVLLMLGPGACWAATGSFSCSGGLFWCARHARSGTTMAVLLLTFYCAQVVVLRSGPTVCSRWLQHILCLSQHVLRCVHRKCMCEASMKSCCCTACLNPWRLMVCMERTQRLVFDTSLWTPTSCSVGASVRVMADYGIARVLGNRVIRSLCGDARGKLNIINLTIRSRFNFNAYNTHLIRKQQSAAPGRPCCKQQ